MQHLTKLNKTNCCPICQETCQFLYSIKGQLSTKNTTELLSCGHYLCSSCYHQWKDHTKKFTCPMCRQEGITSILNFGYGDNTWNTFREFLNYYGDRLYLLQYSNHSFTKMFKRVVKIEKQRRMKQKETKQKSKHKLERAKNQSY